MEPGYVYFTWAELEAMAAHLGMTAHRFSKQYGAEFDAGWQRWAINAMDGQGCPLLDKDRGCRVHPVKPKQCASFPFWPELLDDKEAWQDIKRYCPGLDAEEGRLYSEDEILQIRIESGID